MGAEGDQIIATSTSSNTSRIIISIGISLGTSRLEYPGISCRLAGLGVAKAPCAAVPWRVECKTCTLASHDSSPLGSNLQPNRAHQVEVTHAPCVAASPGAFERGDRHGDVVSVHQAHVVEVLLLTKGDLG